MPQSIWPIHTSTLVLLITLALQSTCINMHPNCQPLSGDEIFSYVRALQNIVPSANHVATRFASGNTGQWFGLAGVQGVYNNAAWPNNQNNIGVIDGLLQQVTSIDWNLQQLSNQNQKRAMADYSITINCQPELLKYSLKKFEDYRDGLYWDTPLKEFVSNTPAMNECINNDAEGTTPFILVQKGAGGVQPSYTIFLCPAAKFLFKPQYSIYNSLQLSLLGVTSATLWQQYPWRRNWNLGPNYSINNFVYMDTMILAALMAIAQGQESSIITGPGRNTDLWAYCFKSQGANWQDPMCLSLWTLTSYLAFNGIIFNSDGYIANAWNAPTLVAPPPAGSQQQGK